MLAPDAAFVLADRDVDTTGFFEGAPDAAFEVVSPSDTYEDVEQKAAINESRSHPSRRGRADAIDTIEIDDVIPGWKAGLREMFG